MPSPYSGPRLPSELFRDLDCQFPVRSSSQSHPQLHSSASTKGPREFARQSQRRQRSVESSKERRYGKRSARRQKTSLSSRLSSGKLVQLETASEATPTAQEIFEDVTIKRASGLQVQRMKKTAAKNPLTRDKRADREDADIAILEKRLGIKTARMPKAFQEDGLGDLLATLDSDLGENQKRRRDENNKWLQEKRRRSVRLGDQDSEGSTSFKHVNSESDSVPPNLQWPLGGSISALDPSEKESISCGSPDAVESESEQWERSPTATVSRTSERQQTATKLAGRHKENPYVAPHQDDSLATMKYIPPYLRDRSQDDDASNKLLRRRVKGLLNRLSDANVFSIIADIEQTYQSYPRQQVTDTIIDLLLDILCDSAPLSDHFIITHAGIISAVYKIIGPEFVAHVLERLVGTFDEQYSLTNRSSTTPDDKAASSNKSRNICSTLSQLYNLHVISSTILFDYLRVFLLSLSELDTELLWIIIRLSGAQLRADDATSLKHITLNLQKSISDKEAADLSVRTKFIIDNIHNLRNNKLKPGTSDRALVTEYVHRMRKTIGQLSDRLDCKATEPIRAALTDIRDKEKKGKWWLIGSSWKGEESSYTNSRTLARINHQLDVDDTITSDREVSFDVLAKSAGMNTTVRRAIFISLLSATDFVEAHRQLSKLALKRSQHPEVARVLLHCASAETHYNPYYTLIAKRLCSSSAMKNDLGDGSNGHKEIGKMQKAFQLALWNLVERLKDAKHNHHGSDEWEDSTSLSAIVNQARLYGELIADEILPITILRKLNMTMLNSKSSIFIESLLLTAMKRLDGHPDVSLKRVFLKALVDPQLSTGIGWFITNVISASDLTQTGKEKDLVRRQCKHVRSILASAN